MAAPHHTENNIDITLGATVWVRTWDGDLVQGVVEDIDSKDGRNLITYGEHWAYLYQIERGSRPQPGSQLVEEYADEDENWEDCYDEDCDDDWV